MLKPLLLQVFSESSVTIRLPLKLRKVASIVRQFQSKIGKHYEVPNMSSMLYEFTNKEQDRVHQSFRTGNYVQIRDLPSVIVPGNVSNQ